VGAVFLGFRKTYDKELHRIAARNSSSHKKQLLKLHAFIPVLSFPEEVKIKPLLSGL